MFDASNGLQLDATVRYVGRLPALNYPAYTELDAGLTWALQAAVELSVVGQNLLDAHHFEQAVAFSSSGMSTQVQRSVYGKVTWRF
jgi:iron complex outermembrane receptor protein